MFAAVITLLGKEITLEWRQRHALAGILLYVFCTVYVVYVSSQNIQPQQWNIFFWIIVLFSVVNALSRSFIQENSARQLYYYSLVPPSAVLLSKIIYNMLLIFILSILTAIILSFVAGSAIKDVYKFFTVLVLGSIGFSTTFTFIAAIAAKSKSGATLTAILGFPIVVPILLLLVKLSASALRLLQDTSIWKDVSMLLSINILVFGMAYLLFPFLWRD